MSKGKVSMRAPLTNSGNGTRSLLPQFSPLRCRILGYLKVCYLFNAVYLGKSRETKAERAEGEENLYESCLQAEALMTIGTDSYFSISLFQKWVLLSLLSRFVISETSQSCSSFLFLLDTLNKCLQKQGKVPRFHFLYILLPVANVHGKEGTLTEFFTIVDSPTFTECLPPSCEEALLFIILVLA